MCHRFNYIINEGTDRVAKLVQRITVETEVFIVTEKKVLE